MIIVSWAAGNRRPQYTVVEGRPSRMFLPPSMHSVRELEKPAFVTGDPEPGHA